MFPSTYSTPELTSGCCLESAAARVDVHRARFIDEFNLDAPQLLELLEMHTGLNTSAANLSAELDQIACGWLNQNTEAWEKWLPDDAIRCGNLFAGGRRGS